jgi:hypothetical protein
MYGTETIKEFLDYGFTVSIRIATVRADDSPGGKKVTIGEIIGSIGLATKIPGLIAEADEVYKEFLDLNDTEVMELKTYFAEKFDIPNDTIEADIEDVWEIVLRTGKIVKRHSK